MFDIGWSELVLIGVVALIAIGPKELPGVLRMVGQWTGKMRRMASEFQSQFQEAMREAEMADLKKQVDDISQSAAKLSSGFDPVGAIRSEIKDAVETATNPPPAADAPLPITPPEPAAAEMQTVPATPEPAAPADAAPPPASQPVSETRPEAGGGR